jgi:O-antigen biosynthesis protein
MVIRRAVFDQVGGFDEQLAIAYNDVDLCIRVRAAGWHIIWTPTAELYHLVGIEGGARFVARHSEFQKEVGLMRQRGRFLPIVRRFRL